MFLQNRESRSLRLSLFAAAFRLVGYAFELSAAFGALSAVERVSAERDVGVGLVLALLLDVTAGFGRLEL